MKRIINFIVIKPIPKGKIVTAYHALTCKLEITSPEFFITIMKFVAATRSKIETEIAIR